MSRDFKPGDFLIFQIESGYGLLRILGIDAGSEDKQAWHLAAYAEMFPDIESADLALESPGSLTITLPHAALTPRAFDATQVSRMKSGELTDADLAPLADWRRKGGAVSDLSIRLILGLR
jgi:hypothetical protein